MKRKAIFLLYRVLQAVLSPAILVWLLTRGFRNPRWFSTLGERFGLLPALWQKTAPGAIWLHAVSVGEVLTAAPLVEEIRARCPGTPVYVSTSTLAGRETADKRLAPLAAGIFYAPFDFVWAVRRVLRLLRPSLLIVMETEIWPNFFRETQRVGCGLMIVNARISDRALPRYRRVRWFLSNTLELCDRVLVQSELMRARYIEAGAPPEIVEAGGNLKYDFRPVTAAPHEAVQAFLDGGSAPVWIAASTSADDRIEEEDAVIAAQHGLKGWRLILVPRQPARFDAVARKLAASGLRWTRRTAMDDPAADVLLLDTIGELSGLFPHAAVVFMGGTIAEKGGHNVLEPAMYGKPVIAGPHLENFRDIEEHFEKHRALLRIASGTELADAVARAGSDDDLGRRAFEAAQMERGATARTADAAIAVYESKYPFDRRAQPGWMLLWTFSQLWRVASARDRRLKQARSRSLPVPAVSVGNITAGGTGKTPVTIELLRDFHAAKPALLTRGHGRSTNDIVLLPRGDENVPVALTGDEAQLYRHESGVPMAIGMERYDAAMRLLERIHVGLFLMDDGFQHLQLKRDFDLVLIDSLHPFGGGHLIPLGRLREPLEGLARAEAFLITRDDEAVNIGAIESMLRHYNPHAPVYRSRTVVRGWTNSNGEALDAAAVAATPAIAFCGLGNPQSFWKSLDHAGIRAVERYEYGDHHRYTPSQIRRLAQRGRDLGVKALLTTAKDAVNLSDGFASMIQPLSLYWLEIGVEIDRRAELLALIGERLRLTKNI